MIPQIICHRALKKEYAAACKTYNWNQFSQRLHATATYNPGDVLVLEETRNSPVLSKKSSPRDILQSYIKENWRQARNNSCPEKDAAPVVVRPGTRRGVITILSDDSDDCAPKPNRSNLSHLQAIQQRLSSGSFGISCSPARGESHKEARRNRRRFGSSMGTHSSSGGSAGDQDFFSVSSVPSADFCDSDDDDNYAEDTPDLLDATARGRRHGAKGPRSRHVNYSERRDSLEDFIVDDIDYEGYRSSASEASDASYDYDDNESEGYEKASIVKSTQFPGRTAGESLVQQLIDLTICSDDEVERMQARGKIKRTKCKTRFGTATSGDFSPSRCLSGSTDSVESDAIYSTKTAGGGKKNKVSRIEQKGVGNREKDVNSRNPARNNTYKVKGRRRSSIISVSSVEPGSQESNEEEEGKFEIEGPCCPGGCMEGCGQYCLPATPSTKATAGATAVVSSPTGKGTLPPPSTATKRAGRSAGRSTGRGRLTRANREALSRSLYQQYNLEVFGASLPADLEIVWSKRLLTTAGLTRYKETRRGDQLVDRRASVELSEKVGLRGAHCG